jgi:hypothetical protein
VALTGGPTAVACACARRPERTAIQPAYRRTAPENFLRVKVAVDVHSNVHSNVHTAGGGAARLGVSFGPVHAGTAEVEGVDPGLSRAFSTRRAEVTGLLAELGATSANAARIATLATRRAKSLPADGVAVEAEELRAGWRRRAREAGLDPDGVAAALGPAREQVVDRAEEVEIAEALLSPTGLTAQRSTFERRDAVRAVAERLADGARLTTVEGLADRAMASGEIVVLGRNGRGGELLCSTRELLALEADLLARAAAAVTCSSSPPTIARRSTTWRRGRGGSSTTCGAH